MRKWLIAGILTFLFPWILSLIWMRAVGAEPVDWKRTETLEEVDRLREVADLKEVVGLKETGSVEIVGELEVSSGMEGDGVLEAVGGMEGDGSSEASGGMEGDGVSGAVGRMEGDGVSGAVGGMYGYGSSEARGGMAGDGSSEAGEDTKDAGKQEWTVRSGKTDSQNRTAEAERNILVERGGIRTYISLEDYLPGVILCQTEAGMEEEVLKCQAVIARTYIVRLMDGRMEIDEKELDFSYPGTFDREILTREKGRDEAVTRLKQCEQAVLETKGAVMCYEGRCILPLFHKISAGRTRTGEKEFPYLQSVESRRDGQEPDYQTEMQWSIPEFTGLLREIGFTGVLNSKEQIQVVKKEDSGYIEQIKIGAKTFSGEEVQYALDLPSACYSLQLQNGKVTARVQGVGHGYGLSQAGACAMARDGWKFEEILCYYYKNISLVSE